MSKTTMVIMVDDDGDTKEYTLGMTRAALRKAEAAGLDMTKMESQTLTQMSFLFYAALLGGGTVVSVDKAFGILDNYLDNGGYVNELMESLAAMYLDVFPTRARD